jgi:hypothetical protein
MTDWTYHGELFLEPGTHYGFVYLITNLKTGRQYIGKKFFWSLRRKQVNKVRKRIKIESDWKTYWSSSDELHADINELGQDNFMREIIYLCPSKGTTNYMEAKEQFSRGVLENKEKWYNGIIQCKIHRNHVKI